MALNWSSLPKGQRVDSHLIRALLRFTWLHLTLVCGLYEIWFGSKFFHMLLTLLNFAFITNVSGYSSQNLLYINLIQWQCSLNQCQFLNYKYFNNHSLLNSHSRIPLNLNFWNRSLLLKSNLCNCYSIMCMEHRIDCLFFLHNSPTFKVGNYRKKKFFFIEESKCEHEFHLFLNMQYANFNKFITNSIYKSGPCGIC